MSTIYIGRLINFMLDQMGGASDAEFLENLLDKYQMGVMPVAVRGFNDTEWEVQGTANEEANYIQEKTFRPHSLHSIGILEKGLQAAKGVVRIVNNDLSGTGFLCGDNLIMTNNHVIVDHEIGQDSDFEFFYELEDDEHMRKDIFIAKAKKNGLFYTNDARDVDFTVIEIEKTPAEAKTLTLVQTQPKQDDWISIIQHPGGEYKQIAMMDNLINFANSRQLQYLTATNQGSSGSPVFSKTFEVMGLHRGSKLITADDGETYLRNIGTNLQLIVDELKLKAPKIYARLNLK